MRRLAANAVWMVLYGLLVSGCGSARAQDAERDEREAAATAE